MPGENPPIIAKKADHRVMHSRGAKPCCLLKYWYVLLTFFGPRHFIYCIWGGVRGRGGNILLLNFILQTL